MDFGIRVKVGNYQILKFSKSLSKKEVKELRDKERVPFEVRQYLQRATLPFIKVSTLSGSWAVEFVIGTTMYNALDELHVVHDAEGNYQLMGNEKTNTEAIFVGMFADTTTVGDFEYLTSKQRLLSEYLTRASKARNREADKGKTDEELANESEEAVQEVIDKEKHSATIIEMGEQLKKDETSKV